MSRAARAMVFGFSDKSFEHIQKTKQYAGEYLSGFHFYEMGNEDPTPEGRWNTVLSGIPYHPDNDDSPRKYFWDHLRPYYGKGFNESIGDKLYESLVTDTGRGSATEIVDLMRKKILRYFDDKFDDLTAEEYKHIFLCTETSYIGYDMMENIVRLAMNKGLADYYFVVSNTPKGILGVFGNELPFKVINKKTIIKGHDFFDIFMSVFLMPHINIQKRWGK